MQLRSVRVGDLVLADVRGRRFVAHVDSPPCNGEVAVTPLGQDSYRRVTARQVVSHYARRGGDAGQLRSIVGAARRRAGDEVGSRQRSGVPA